MTATTATVEAGNSALRFLLTGSFADFELRCQGYRFNVHRAVIAGQSLYFENVCGGHFKEGKDGFVELDEHPLYVAVLVLGLYKGTYTFEDHETIKKIMDNAYSAGSTVSAGNKIVKVDAEMRSRLPHELHTAMFAMAEYYEAPVLMTFAVKEFKTLATSDNSPFTLNALVDAIDMVYNQHVTISDSLRAITIYWAQVSDHDLIKLPKFQRLFHDTPSFAWDVAMLYGRASRLYCSVCCKEAVLKDCDCGLRGICGHKHCSTNDMTTWTCQGCGTTGQMTRENKDLGCDVEKTIGEKHVQDSVEALNQAIVKSPGRKRRAS